MGIRGGLGLRVREERIVLRHTVIWTCAEVGHHDEPPHARLRGSIDHPDRGVPVDGVGPRRVAAAGPGGEDDRVVPGQQTGQRVRVELLDIGRNGLAPVAAISSEWSGLRKTEVTSSPRSVRMRASCSATFPWPPMTMMRAIPTDGTAPKSYESETRPMIRSMMGLPGGNAPVSDAIVCP